MSGYKLGDPVTFTGIMRKDKGEGVMPGALFVRKWHVKRSGAERDGIIVGKRVIANNYVVQETDKLLPSAVDVERITVYLVAYDMQKAPVYVPAECLTRRV